MAGTYGDDDALDRHAAARGRITGAAARVDDANRFLVSTTARAVVVCNMVVQQRAETSSVEPNNLPNGQLPVALVHRRMLAVVSDKFVYRKCQHKIVIDTTHLLGGNESEKRLLSPRTCTFIR